MNRRRSVAARLAGALVLELAVAGERRVGRRCQFTVEPGGDEAVLGDVEGARPPCESDADRRVQDLSRVAKWCRRRGARGRRIQPEELVVSALPVADPVPGAVRPDRGGRRGRPELAQGERLQGHEHPGEPPFHRRAGHRLAGRGRVPHDAEHLQGLGQNVRAPSTNLSVPATIAGLISGAIGIDESYNFVHTNTVIDKKAPPSPGFRNAPPLSTSWAQMVSPYAYPTGFTDLSNPATAPWTVKGYTPAQIKGAYGISGYDGAGQTVADHRRLRVADDPPGRQPVVDQPRPADDERRPVQAGRAARHLPATAEQEAGSAGLVRRGDARRRGRPRHGSRREHRLRRRAEQLPGPRRGDEPRRRPAPRPDRHELLRLRTASSCRPASSSRSSDTSSRPRSKASASTSPPATTATRRPSSASPSPTGRHRARG